MTRIQKIQKKLVEQNIDAFLITNPSNIYYLCGFRGSKGLLYTTKEQSEFLTDDRYQVEAYQHVQDSHIHIITHDILPYLMRLVKQSKAKTIGFEQDHLTYGEYQQLSLFFSGIAVLKALPGWVEKLRAQKDRLEIQKIRHVVELTDRVFQNWLKILKPDIEEYDVALELEYQLRQAKAEKMTFEPIVISGKRTALPHGKTSRKKLKRGELVMIDVGCFYDGYTSDMTRTVILGHSESWQVQMYDAVWQAQTTACEKARAGLHVKELDGIARHIIGAAGFGDYFSHGLGHGIGIDLHESPRVSYNGTERLLTNMVFTIEPGVYLPQQGGVRIEDVVLVGEERSEILTQTSKELLII